MCRIENRTGNVLRFALIIFIMSCILYFGCGSDPEEDQGATPEESLQSGWTDYDSREYGMAILAFEKVFTEDVPTAIAADAYNGLGWVYLSFSRSAGVNQKNIATALSKFQEAIAHDATNADAWVGQAGLLLARRGSQDDLRKALEAIDKALQGNSEYLYRHDYDSEADLHALKAQCYYYLGERGKTLDEVNRVLAIEKNNIVALAIKGLL